MTLKMGEIDAVKEMLGEGEVRRSQSSLPVTDSGLKAPHLVRH